MPGKVRLRVGKASGWVGLWQRARVTVRVRVRARVRVRIRVRVRVS